MEEKNLETDVGFPAQRSPDVICRRCGTANEPGDRCHNPTCKSTILGNQLARTNGLYARHLPPDLQMRVDDFRAGVISDGGGTSELSAIKTGYIQKLAGLEGTLHLLVDDIARNGLFTPGGRVRPVYEKLLAGLAAWDRYAQRIGMERQTKPVHPLDVVRRAVEDANK